MIEVGEIYITTRCGKLEVVEYRSANSIDVRFLDTGTVITTYAQSIRSGKVADPMTPTVRGVGFIGIGPHKSKFKYKQNKAHKVWEGMIHRCYADKRTQEKKYPTYAGVAVCDEWHNFQNFAEWFESNYPNDGMKWHLDKDKIGDGSLYSPRTCVFISPKENTQIAHAAKMNEFTVVSPDGMIFTEVNQHEFCRSHGLIHSNFCKMLNGKTKSHRGWRLDVSQKLKEWL